MIQRTGARDSVKRRLAPVVTVVALSAGSLHTSVAQGAATAPDSALRTRRGAQFLIPLGSLFIPGLGQYLQGAPAAGAAFTGTAVAGYVVYITGDTAAARDIATRSPEGQQSLTGLLMLAGASELSAYDAFRRALPALQRKGKYRFTTSHPPVSALLTAPFDPRFLTRWTTWIQLAYTGVIAALILSERESGVAYEPYRPHDAGYLTCLSLSAGTGEEALFRGWLLPWLDQNTGGRFWLSNGMQAMAFGALHIGRAKEGAAVIAVWAVYEGWLTRRNAWNVRESVFQHFWYDAIVATATFLTDERRAGVAVRFPTIRF